MKRVFVFLLLAQLAPSQLVDAQSLAGVWVSEHIILVLVNFSITFNSDMSYAVDCILGKAVGTYATEDGKILFTPTKSDINNAKANDIGGINIYAYEFTDESTLHLSSGWVSIILLRKEVYENRLKGQK